MQECFKNAVLSPSKESNPNPNSDPDPKYDYNPSVALTPTLALALTLTLTLALYSHASPDASLVTVLRPIIGKNKNFERPL